MKSKLLAMFLIAGSTMFAGVRFGVGIGFGAPAPVVVTAPPYPGAYWVAPGYYGGRYVAGYWAGERRIDRDDYRRFDHYDHRFDRDGHRFDHDRGRR